MHSHKNISSKASEYVCCFNRKNNQLKPYVSELTTVVTAYFHNKGHQHRQNRAQYTCVR